MAEAVGNAFKIAIGKKAGRFNVLWHLEKTGRTANDERVQEMVDRIKESSQRKRRALSNEEFGKIFDKVVTSKNRKEKR
jgi:isopropylmalate/homocitrate/citramalate synthase